MHTQDFDDSYFLSREKDVKNRTRMHQIDFKYVIKSIGMIQKNQTLNLLDIGCSDGSFLSHFKDYGFKLYGIEPNKKESLKASMRGINIIDSINKMHELDVIILRGTLHHLPNHQLIFDQIFKAFFRSRNQKSKYIFILAEPNKECFIYKKFKRLPAIEENLSFKSNYQIFGANELSQYFKRLGFKTKISYPYFKSPYRNLFRDLYAYVKMYFKKEYSATPMYRNMFNLVVFIPFDFKMATLKKF